MPRTHKFTSASAHTSSALRQALSVHYLSLSAPSLHRSCFYSLYTWQSHRSRKHSRAEVGACELVPLLCPHQEVWQPPLRILTCLTHPQETIRGSGGQNLPPTGCLSLFWFYITLFCKVSNCSHWKYVHWGHSQTLTLKREKWAHFWVLRAEPLVPIIYHKVPNT